MTKTCEECKFYIAMSRCTLYRQFVDDDDCCDNYTPKPLPLTNGDKIRQMNNEELARKFGYPCPPIPKKHCKGINNEECTECWLNWLNAPADSVKQNGDHYTQTDLCKVYKTESEGEE